MFSSLWNWASNQPSQFCRKDFPPVFSGFVEHLTDTLHAQGPAYHPTQIQKQGTQEPVPFSLPPVERLVAIGDLHGDFEKTQRAFRTANLIDENNQWCGGNATAVQVGDQLDRGGDEIKVLYFLEKLQEEARKAGGALHILNGNHETLNTQGRFRYVTQEGVSDFGVWKYLEDLAQGMKTNCKCTSTSENNFLPSPQEALDSRKNAVAPGGSIARRFFAPHPIILQVGSTVFVHGGILPQHTEYGLERINEETREWFLGNSGPKIPAFLSGKDAVVWARDYSTEDKQQCNCEALEEALKAIPGAKRMVVGHTIQDDGINTACDNKVYRIDVGLSQGCGNGDPEVLEILHDKECRSLHERNGLKEFGIEPIKNIEPESVQTESLVGSWWHWFKGTEKEQEFQTQNAR